MNSIQYLKSFTYMEKQKNHEQSSIEGGEAIAKIIVEVGDNGRYQTSILILSIILILEIGIVLNGAFYTFAVAPYSQCPAPHTGISKCTKYVCSLPQSQRAQYENPQIASLKTLGNAFGNYHCSKSYQISFAIGLLWIGAVVGATVASLIADNFGRRITLITF